MPLWVIGPLHVNQLFHKTGGTAPLPNARTTLYPDSTMWTRRCSSIGLKPEMELQPKAPPMRRPYTPKPAVRIPTDSDNGRRETGRLERLEGGKCCAICTVAKKRLSPLESVDLEVPCLFGSLDPFMSINYFTKREEQHLCRTHGPHCTQTIPCGHGVARALGLNQK